MEGKIRTELMQPLVSIIVPIFKVENYLYDAVDSAVQQSYRHTEIILSDDGSPDNCPGICDDYAVADDRVIVIHKKNGGLSDARNYGIDLANGEYLCTLDSDDMYRSDFVCVLLDRAMKDNAGIVICNIDEIAEDDTPREKSSYQKVVDDCYDSTEALGLLSTKVENTCSVAWNKLYHRNVWEQCRYPYGKIHEDVFVIHHLMGNAQRISTISQALYVHRLRAGSIMTTRKANSYRCALEAFCDKLNYFLEHQQLKTVEKIDTECFEVIKSAYWSHYFDDPDVAKAIRTYHSEFETKVSQKGFEKFRRKVFWISPLLERVMTIIYRRVCKRIE